METMTLKYWLEGNYSEVVKILILIVFTVISIIRFIPSELTDFVVNSVSKFFKLLFNSQTLETNQLFYAKDRLFLQIEAIDLKDDDKEKLFKILLKNKVDITINKVKTFVKENKDSLKNWNAAEFKMKVETLYQDIKNDYRLKTINDYNAIYGQLKGTQLFNYIYKKGFAPYHKANVEFVESFIETVSISNIKDNYTKLDNVLFAIYVSLEKAIADIEITFDSFNGDFEKIINS